MELYDFYADWCQPCKMMGPTIDQLEQERPDIRIIRVNVDSEPLLASQFGVRSVPTYVLKDESQTITRIQGAKPKAKFYELLGLDN